MDEVDRLKRAIKEVQAKGVPAFKIKDAYRRVIFHGVRVHRWTQETAALLEEQLTWLDANTSAPSYEKRFLEWEQLLRGYEQASRLLDEAKAMAVMAA